MSAVLSVHVKAGPATALHTARQLDEASRTMPTPAQCKATTWCLPSDASRLLAFWSAWLGWGSLPVWQQVQQ